MRRRQLLRMLAFGCALAPLWVSAKGNKGGSRNRIRTNRQPTGDGAETAEGTVETVSASERIVVLKGSGGPRPFSVPVSCWIETSAGVRGQLSDLQEGMRVSVRVSQGGIGKLVATAITIKGGNAKKK